MHTHTHTQTHTSLWLGLGRRGWLGIKAQDSSAFWHEAQRSSVTFSLSLHESSSLAPFVLTHTQCPLQTHTHTHHPTPTPSPLSAILEQTCMQHIWTSFYEHTHTIAPPLEQPLPQPLVPVRCAY